MASNKAGARFELTYENPLYFEKDFDVQFTNDWMSKHSYYPVIVAVVYIVGIYALQRLMANRTKMDLRMPLALWSFVLAIFNAMFFVRCAVPEVIHTWSRHGWQHTVCSNAFYYGHTGVWVFLFTMSKVYELGDTLFVLLRKQPLIFLHWYHHVTVVLFTWYGYVNFSSTSRWFGCVNSFVHVLMYAYYTCRALRVMVPRWVSMTITIIQSSQMLFGICVNVNAYWVLSQGGECDVTYADLTCSSVVYVSYFVLFLSFFYNAYIVPAYKKSSNRQSSTGLKMD